MPLLPPIPGLDEAVEEESQARLMSFLAKSERICGIEVQLFTPRLAMELEAAGSPFVIGKRSPGSGDVAVFMWAVSKQRMRPRPWFLTQAAWLRINQRWFIRSLARLDIAAVYLEVLRYLEEASADGPGDGGSSDSLPFASWASSIVDAFAARYGWLEERTLDTPFKRLWQYWRRWQAREEGKTNFINLRSHKVRADFLATLNKPEGN